VAKSLKLGRKLSPTSESNAYFRRAGGRKEEAVNWAEILKLATHQKHTHSDTAHTHTYGGVEIERGEHWAKRAIKVIKAANWSWSLIHWSTNRVRKACKLWIAKIHTRIQTQANTHSLTHTHIHTESYLNNRRAYHRRPTTAFSFISLPTPPPPTAPFARLTVYGVSVCVRSICVCPR